MQIPQQWRSGRQLTFARSKADVSRAAERTSAVAGDQLKAASDLGVPVAGVGLLYQQGYFRQVIDKNGEQQALFPYNDPGQLPITPLRDRA